MTFLILLTSFVTLTSCGDGDKDEPSGGSNSIVGTWRCDNHYSGGSDYYTFNSGGTYTWKCPGSWFNPDSGNYTFSNGLLILVNKKGTSWTYLVQFSNKNTFILMDEDGDSYTYVRE